MSPSNIERELTRAIPGCFYKGNYFYGFFFSVGSGVLLEVNSGGGGWNFFSLSIGGGV
jgi:hypothetical protein